MTNYPMIIHLGFELLNLMQQTLEENKSCSSQIYLRMMHDQELKPQFYVGMATALKWNIKQYSSLLPTLA